MFSFKIAAKYQNRRTMSSSDRALIAAFKEISTMADRINLPKTIVDRANNLFKQVSVWSSTMLSNRLVASLVSFFVIFFLSFHHTLNFR